MMHLLTVITCTLIMLLASQASAQSWQAPADSQRCPSKWGATDSAAPAIT